MFAETAPRSEVLGDLFEFVHRTALISLQRPNDILKAVVEVILDQRFLRLTDRLFHRMKLLRDVETTDFVGYSEETADAKVVAIVREGEDLSIPTPVNHTLTCLIQAIQETYQESIREQG